MKATLAILLVLLAGACGSSPTAPSSTPTRWPLAGTARSTSGDPINGAAVAILDGPEVGRQATTDALGRFGIPGLSQGNFTARERQRLPVGEQGHHLNVGCGRGFSACAAAGRARRRR